MEHIPLSVLRDLQRLATHLWMHKREIVANEFSKPHILLKRHEQLSRIDLDRCTNSLGFSYAVTGWHPVTALLRENPSGILTVPLQQSVFARFFPRYCPTSMRDLPDQLDEDVSFAPPVGVLPWGGFTRQEAVTGGTPLRETSWLFGPLDDQSIRLNMTRTFDVYASLKRSGYAPWRPFNSFIEGCFLERSNGDRMFVVMHGKHRAAVLRFLGFESVVVRCTPDSVRVIRERDVHNWYYVKSGECSREDALAYFRAYFELSGRERAVKLGLVAAS